MFSRVARPALARAAVASPAPALSNNYATLREIEGRLKSIRNIEKITNTMKVVASTKLARAQRAMDNSKVYGEASNKVFTSAETQPIEGGKKLIIVASSDKGLCGGIHSQLSKAARAELEKNPDADIAVLGEKCKAQLSRSHGKNLVLSFSNIGKDIPSFVEAQAVADEIMKLDAKYDDIKVIFNQFKSAISYEPAAVPAFSEDAIKASANYSAFEVDDEELPNLREFALANTIYWALAEGHACEQSARRNAMDNASKNAGEMINKFQILFNRTRQAVITGELVEIITGAAASEES